MMRQSALGNQQTGRYGVAQITLSREGSIISKARFSETGLEIHAKVSGCACA